MRCAKVVLDTIEAKLPKGKGSVVLHWFTGSPFGSTTRGRDGLLLLGERENV